MKSLIRKNIYKYLGVKEPLGLRPDSTSVYSIQNASISDCFCWRTDQGYKTVFRFTDILELFYEINSTIEIIFYSKNNKFIKKIILDKNNLSNELIIDKIFMNNIESYGVFFIFHQSDRVDLLDLASPAPITYAYLETTNYCNLQCSFCNRDDVIGKRNASGNRFCGIF